jgi:trimeric autotransporter adhesin
MKKSIGIIAAVLVSASAYSQQYSGPDRGLTGNPEGDNLRSRQFESGAPTESGQFDVQESSSPNRSASVDNSSSASTSSSESSTSNSSSYDSSGSPATSESGSGSASLEAQDLPDSAKQGFSLNDQEAAGVLRESDDPDLANRNNERRAQEEGLAESNDLNSDFSLRKGSESDPDMIYEEWYLFGPVESDQSVGAPAESESGSSSSRSLDNSGTSGELDNNDPQSQFDADVQESGELNDSRVYNGSDDYWRDNSGSPATSESGRAHVRSGHDDSDCDTELEGKGSAAEYESDTVRGSGSAIDSDERQQIDRSKDFDQNTSVDNETRESKDQSQGSAASGDTSSSKSSAHHDDEDDDDDDDNDSDSDSSRGSLNRSESRDYPESSSNTTPDL